MSPGKSPFVKKEIICPVCGSPSENRFIMPKSFVEKEVESDRHVKEYKWMDSDFEGYHPPFYHFWHCTTCKYTSSQRDFLKPGQDQQSNFSLIKRCVQQMNPNQKQIVQLLGSSINYDNMTFCMAMNAHLLALYIQELTPTVDRDDNKIASYYLRTGWLIREQMAKDDPDGEFKKYKEFLAKLGKLWESVPQSEAECMNAAAENFQKAYQNHPRYADILHATDLMILIAEIYLRADNMKLAMKSLNSVMQTGQKHRAQMGETMRKDKEAGRLTATRKAQLDAQANKVNVLMEKAGDMRQEIIKVKIAKQEPKAKEVVAKLEARGMDAEDIREKLKEFNFEPQLITRLLGEQKRKKFLGLF
ncbi:MAG: DUF2225 domain-containing protein [Candidatus Glassbacteria bacterium]|nr:DUF2225 domain-containing protein [Candidatus Glassbacteria bacterium]